MLRNGHVFPWLLFLLPQIPETGTCFLPQSKQVSLWNHIGMVARDFHYFTYHQGWGTPCNHLACNWLQIIWQLTQIQDLIVWVSFPGPLSEPSALDQLPHKEGRRWEFLFKWFIEDSTFQRNGLGKLIHRVSPALRQGAGISYTRSSPGGVFGHGPPEWSGSLWLKAILGKRRQQWLVRQC